MKKEIEERKKDNLGRALSDINQSYIEEAASVPPAAAGSGKARRTGRTKLWAQIGAAAAVIMLSLLFVLSIPVFNRMITGVPEGVTPAAVGTQPAVNRNTAGQDREENTGIDQPAEDPTADAPKGPENSVYGTPDGNVPQGQEVTCILPGIDIPMTTGGTAFPDITSAPSPDTSGPILPYTDEVPAAHAHAFGEWSCSSKGSCSEPQIYVRTCAVCLYCEETITPAAGHDFGPDGICRLCGARDMPITVPVDHPGVPVTSAAVRPENPGPKYSICDGFYYTANPDGKTCTIQGSDSSAVTKGILELPAVLNGLTVTAIAPNAFYGRSDIFSVITSGLPITVGRMAFYNCSAMTSLCTDGMTDIGDSAFGSCHLYELHIYPSVTSIGQGAFGFNPIHTMHFEEGGTEPLKIESKAFAYLSEINFVHLPKRTAYLDPGAFAYDSKLLIVSCAAEKIWQDAGIISDCPALFSDCPAALVFTDIEDFIMQFSMLRYDMGTSSDPEGIGITVTGVSDSFHGTEITVPDRIGPWVVAEIGEGAFRGSDTLTRVVLPDTVHTIGERAFADCPELLEVVINQRAALTSANAFENSPKVQLTAGMR